MKRFTAAVIATSLAACTQAQPVETSQEVLWKKYGNQSIDNVLLAMGTPAGETKLTDGSRLVTYRHATLVDAGSRYEQSTDCEVNLLARPPAFHVDNIAMKGDDYECQLLAGGHTGQAVTDYTPPPGPEFYHPYTGGPRF